MIDFDPRIRLKPNIAQQPPAGNITMFIVNVDYLVTCNEAAVQTVF